MRNPFRSLLFFDSRPVEYFFSLYVVFLSLFTFDYSPGWYYYPNYLVLFCFFSAISLFILSLHEPNDRSFQDEIHRMALNWMLSGGMFVYAWATFKVASLVIAGSFLGSAVIIALCGVQSARVYYYRGKKEEDIAEQRRTEKDGIAAKEGRIHWTEN